MISSLLPLATETQEAVALAQWCSLHNILAIHITNEGKRSKIQGALLKRMGLTPGASDFFIAEARGKYHGLFIELKRNYKKATLTDKQIKFLADVEQRGYCGLACWGAERAIEDIEVYMLGGIPFKHLKRPE